MIGALLTAACGGGGHSGAAKMEQRAAPADLVFSGGTVLTMDPLRPRAEAVAVRAGRIVFVGDQRDARALIGPGTRVVDLAGGTLTPGLVDAHCHLYGLGKSLEQLPLKGLASERATADVVAKVAAARPKGEWIQGRGWDQNLWSPATFPTRAALDAVAPDHPVILRRVDGHAAWVSSAALRAAGITRDTPDPPGGKIIRDAKGEPTGVLVDNGVDLVLKVVPADSAASRERMILAAADLAVARGLAGVHEMGIDDATVAVYRKLVAEGRLKLRVYAFLAGEEQMDSLPSRKPDVDADGSARFTLRAVKLYADGALGSRGAALLEPYSDDPPNRGLELASKDELTRVARIAADAGWQLGVHAIGDRANRNVLDAFAPLAGRDVRFRIEHAQVVAPADMPRFAQLGVIAAMQPTHATSDMPWAEARLGPERVKGAYAWRTLAATGAHIAGGSDFPIEEVSPLLGLYAAVTRQDAAGQPAGGWYPEQRLTLEEAVRIFTVEPAWASFVEGKRGVIQPGAVADFTWLDRELHEGASLLEAKVRMTVVGGDVVYEAR